MTEPQSSQLPPPDRSPPLDRWFWTAIALAAVVVIPRSLLVASAHSQSYDDQYHLVRGLLQLSGEKHVRLGYNDPPLGELLIALPMWISGATFQNTANDPLVRRISGRPWEAILSGQPVAAEQMLLILAAWKSLLLLPGVAVIFQWCRRLYGLPSAWLATALVLIEPTFTANISIPALDVLGVEAILIACYTAWSYFESPTTKRLLAMTFAAAAALLIKHTAVVVPAVVLVYAAMHWRSCPLPLSLRRKNALIGIGTFLLFLWALTLFDFSRPRDRTWSLRATYTENWNFMGDVVNANLMRSWPAGIYVSSLVTAYHHNDEGHGNYLLGQVSREAWWYYYAVVAMLKTPVGVMVVLLTGLASFVWRPLRRAEWSLIIPAMLYAVLIARANVNIGFRHALPAYVLMMLLASRCLIDAGRIVKSLAWGGAIAAGVNGLWWHPNYIAFINVPIDRPERFISDSNLDWGQSLRQVRHWLDRNPHPGRPVHIGYFGNQARLSIAYYLGDRVKWWNYEYDEPLPTSGLLIVSPVVEGGAWASPQLVAPLKQRRPIAVIGDCMRVYDLDAPP